MKTPTKITGEQIRQNIRKQFDLLLEEHPEYELVLRETSDDQFRKWVILNIVEAAREAARQRHRYI
jgi:hypothetical protein